MPLDWSYLYYPSWVYLNVSNGYGYLKEVLDGSPEEVFNGYFKWVLDQMGV